MKIILIARVLMMAFVCEAFQLERHTQIQGNATRGSSKLFSYYLGQWLNT